MVETNTLRRPDKKLKRQLDKLFVPVIFANGEDDDLPGFIAAASNIDVQYDEKIYKPNESIFVFKRKMVFCANGLQIIGPEDEWPPVPDGWAVVRSKNSGRTLTIDSCYIYFRGCDG